MPMQLKAAGADGRAVAAELTGKPNDGSSSNDRFRCTGVNKGSETRKVPK
jgi:hypothetical protein